MLSYSKIIYSVWFNYLHKTESKLNNNVGYGQIFKMKKHLTRFTSKIRMGLHKLVPWRHLLDDGATVPAWGHSIGLCFLFAFFQTTMGISLFFFKSIYFFGLPIFCFQSRCIQGALIETSPKAQKQGELFLNVALFAFP